jgi:hypothetical protein
LAPKQVVYLWGAGATQAEIDYLGAKSVNLLMRDNAIGTGVATRIVQQLSPKERSSFESDQGTDIEKLISLLAASNVNKYHELADNIRKLYFEEICRSLVVAGILPKPSLAMSLLQMHSNTEFQKYESLAGVVTTNHDGLMQLASQKVHGHLDIGVPFDSADLTPSQTRTAPVLQLHGSFTWTFGLPVRVTLLKEASTYSRDTVWIPPAILKEAKSYPFNKLAALAYELLSKCCTVLRVVGSSLTQNDWNILSMIFNAQRHLEHVNDSPFRIELIMPQASALTITRECSYLRGLTPIGELSEGAFADYKEEVTATPDMKNPLFYWLKEKVQFHRRRGELGTATLPPELGQIAGDAP